MEWELLTKTVKDINGKDITIELDEQVDEVGNLVQRMGKDKIGGIIPKACQKCKKEFKSEIKEFPIIQKVPFYKCKDCDFENAGGDATLGHKIENMEHNIKKIVKDRVVTIERRLVGTKANINKTEDDVIILCDICLNG